MVVEAIKRNADDENEIHDLEDFVDPAQNVVTPVASLPPAAAEALVNALSAVVRRGHASPVALVPDEDAVIRAQTFEEGDVYMTEKPFDGYSASRYLMDFYDTKARDICSRMHFHTGARLVRMMTGPETVIQVSSLSPLLMTFVKGVTTIVPRTYRDSMPGTPPGRERTRHNLIVPANSIVDMQVPRGTSHQFNAIGSNAVIDTVHPEESIEVFREKMTGLRMMAQTIFLSEHRATARECLTNDIR
ncbi:hypothetical protein [Actinomadura chibensis]|uniref:Uncharacterized protein n=1 Tax=Actinomadura chibensis TaxID=392828 RepID=A0A5D0NV19_9ACTN|nr:hypothetical protein [Actinomadura chibensis]TYB48530.1 hypothetical protein FXF69_04910 [Actinomadura chibensis]